MYIHISIYMCVYMSLQAKRGNKKGTYIYIYTYVYVHTHIYIFVCICLCRQNEETRKGPTRNGANFVTFCWIVLALVFRYCNTLQHTATHFNALQHISTHSSTLQDFLLDCDGTCVSVLQHIVTHRNSLQSTYVCA